MCVLHEKRDRQINLESLCVYRKRDEELTIRQQELQLEHRHAQLKEQLNLRLSTSSKFQRIVGGEHIIKAHTGNY